MDGFQVICTIFVTVVAYADFCMADHEYMVTSAESITVPIGFQTTLQCLMNIEPDKFQWKFYPLATKDASNPTAFISLTTSKFEFVPPQHYTMTTQKRQSVLTIKADSYEDSMQKAGDYQCLAHYGASVVASVPWRLTIAVLGQFPKQDNIEVIVVAGNTINWRCEPPPEGNPEPYIEYYINDKYITPSITIKTKSLVMPNITTDDTGKYTCKVFNAIMGTMTSSTFLDLKVVKSGPPQVPRFIMPPRDVYTVKKGDSVFLECAAVGNPVPEVVWKKRSGIIPEKRSEMVKGGLIIRNVSSSDDGVYECNQKNSRGSISHQITLIYNEPPRISCLLNSTEAKQGDNLDLDCPVTGIPKPQISWFLNGFSVNDSEIEVKADRIYFRTVEKRHAGNLQIFARNVIETVYSSISIKVIPLSTTQDSSNDNLVPPTRGNHRNNWRKSPKHAKMIPPSKPTVSRINDEAVVVRWNVQPNKGLPIKFFKVQYKELGPANQHEHHNRGKNSRWMTPNAEIPPHIRSYEVDYLKSDHWYRFRIAAVYSNDDNKNSPNSDKFHLRRLDFDKRNPLPIPLITKTEPVNSTSVKIYWTCDTTPDTSIEGFFVNYNSASSAGDYLRETANGRNADSYVLSHLQPDTAYDIKLQSFSSNSASDYSRIMKAKTTAPEMNNTSPPLQQPITPSSLPDSAGISKLYIIIAAGVLGSCGVISATIALLLFCRKWKQKKNTSRSDHDKPGVDEHHIQADGNEYVVGPKSATRANGCVAPNRITITANPLADADNKNQNMIEMSCLSSQNNNCSTIQPSASGEDLPTNSRDKKNKNREKRIRNKNVEPNKPGENYV